MCHRQSPCTNAVPGLSCFDPVPYSSRPHNQRPHDTSHAPSNTTTVTLRSQCDNQSKVTLRRQNKNVVRLGKYHHRSWVALRDFLDSKQHDQTTDHSSGCVTYIPLLHTASIHLEFLAELIQTPSTFRLKIHLPPRTTLASQHIQLPLATDLQPHIKSAL